MGIKMKYSKKAGKKVPATVPDLTQKRVRDRIAGALAKKKDTKRTARESYDKADFEAAKRRGKGIYTPAEQAQIKKFKEKRKAWARKKAVQKKRIKKASTRVVKKSKGYA